MFNMLGTMSDSNLNQEKIHKVQCFCKALKEYKMSNAVCNYYADPEPFSDRETPLELFVSDLIEMLEIIDQSTLKIIQGLEKKNSLKVEFRESLMVLLKIFFKMFCEKKWALNDQNIFFSDVQKEKINEDRRRWMQNKMELFFSDVLTFESKYMRDIEGVTDFVYLVIDFFPREEEYDLLFADARQEFQERFWGAHLPRLEKGLFNVLGSAFIVKAFSLAPSVHQEVVVPAGETLPPLADTKNPREINLANPGLPPQPLYHVFQRKRNCHSQPVESGLKENISPIALGKRPKTQDPSEFEAVENRRLKKARYF